MLVGGGLFIAVNRDLEKTTQRGAESLARVVVESLDQVLYERSRDVLVFATLSVVHALDRERLADIADQLVKGYRPYYELAFAVDRTGRIVGINRVDGNGSPMPTAQLLGRSVAEERWFKDALDSEEPVVDDAHIDPLVEAVAPAQRPVVSFSVPIKDASGTIVGVWSTRVSLAALESALAARSRYVGSESHFTFPLLVRSPSDAGVLIRLGPWTSVGGEAKTRLLLASATSVGFMGRPGLGWRVEVYHPGEGLSRETILVGLGIWGVLLVAGGGVGLGLIVHRRLVRPLLVLKELVDREARLVHAIPTERPVTPAESPSYYQAMAGQQVPPDELGDLMRAVETMVREVESQVARLVALNNIADGLHREVVSIPALLARIVHTARELTGARYAALAVFDETGKRIDQFVTAGIDDVTRAAIGQLPTGRGLLGAVLKEAGVLRVADVRQHPAFSGFPPHHPVMTSFLGVAIRTSDRIFGRLYLTNKETAGQKPAQFTELDAEMVAALAHQATSALENATLLRKVRTNETRYQAILNSVEEGIFGVDLSGFCLFVNRAGASKLGYQPDELVGQRLHRLIHAKQADGRPCAEEVCPLFEAGRMMQPRRLDDEILWHRNDTCFPVTCMSAPLYEDDAVVGVVISFMDMTDRQQLEARLRQAQRMEAIGRLAGGIAHDFNNILTVILGYSTLLLNQVDSSRRPVVEQIQQAGKRAAALTKQILDFSRKQLVAPQVVDLNIIVGEMESLLRRLVGEHIDLLVVPGANLDRVKVDPSQLEQVIMNLVINARDAMPDGGRLIIETANVELDEAYCCAHPDVKPGLYAMLAVSDNGCGMDAATLARCLEPFFTTKPKGKGTGLGLSTVYGIVKQHGGTLSLYSELGQGTTVKIFLPSVEEDLTTPAPVEQRPGGAKPCTETVLVAEDDQAVRAFIHMVLDECGYTVLIAANGEEALEISARYHGRIHLLLTDVVLSGINGRLLAERLQAQRDELKVLYMSGYTDNAIVHQGILDSSIAFLRKPFTADALRNKVRDVLES